MDLAPTVEIFEDIVRSAAADGDNRGGVNFE